MTEAMCDKLTAVPAPHPPTPLWGWREKNQGEVQPGKKGGVGEDVLQIWFYFSLSYSGLICNKTGFPDLSLLCP